MLVDNFVLHVLTVKYPFASETTTLKVIEKEIVIVTTEWDSIGKKEHSSWQNSANYTNISKYISDRWIYCNQEPIARRALAKVLHDIQIRLKKIWQTLWEMDDKRK